MVLLILLLLAVVFLIKLDSSRKINETLIGSLTLLDQLIHFWNEFNVQWLRGLQIKYVRNLFLFSISAYNCFINNSLKS